MLLDHHPFLHAPYGYDACRSFDRPLNASFLHVLPRRAMSRGHPDVPLSYESKESACFPQSCLILFKFLASYTAQANAIPLMRGVHILEYAHGVDKNRT